MIPLFHYISQTQVKQNRKLLIGLVYNNNIIIIIHLGTPFYKTISQLKAD